MNTEDLDAIQARADAATEGPWHVEHDNADDYEAGINYGDYPYALHGPKNASLTAEQLERPLLRDYKNRVSEVSEMTDADATFIAAARTDVPALIAVVRSLEARSAKAERAAKTLGEVIDKQCRDVLDVTGLHHLINEDGDGHWDIVWMRLFEMRDELADLKESTLSRERHRGDSWRDQAQKLQVSYEAAIERADGAERALLALVRSQQAQIERVEDIHFNNSSCAHRNGGHGMSGMAEVLAAHQWSRPWHSDTEFYECICGEQTDNIPDHQAHMLAAAGFGPVKEAAAKALEGAADHMEAFGVESVGEQSLRNRAAAVRGDS